MNFSAVIPAADLAIANAALAEVDGVPTEWGDNNFSIPAHDGSGSGASHAALHAWDMPDFIAAVKALPNVQWSELPGDPKDRIADALSKVGAEWGAQAKPLTGQVTPGLHEDDDGQMWLVIQPFDRSVFTQALADLPALVRRARTPGVAEPWVQPLDGENAYRVLDPWTGAGEVATHEGKTWRVTQGDGAGNNVFEPGTLNAGWEEVDPVTFEPIAPKGIEWVEGDTFAVGDERTYQGVLYRCITAHTAFVGAGWTPPASPTLWTEVVT